MIFFSAKLVSLTRVLSYMYVLLMFSPLRAVSSERVAQVTGGQE